MSFMFNELTKDCKSTDTLAMMHKHIPFKARDKISGKVKLERHDDNNSQEPQEVLVIVVMMKQMTNSIELQMSLSNMCF